MSLDKKLTEVFTIFQDKDKNVVSVKDIPTIIRCLGKLQYIVFILENMNSGITKIETILQQNTKEKNK